MNLCMIQYFLNINAIWSYCHSIKTISRIRSTCQSWTLEMCIIIWNRYNSRFHVFNTQCKREDLDVFHEQDKLNFRQNINTYVTTLISPLIKWSELCCSCISLLSVFWLSFVLDFVFCKLGLITNLLQFKRKS